MIKAKDKIKESTVPYDEFEFEEVCPIEWELEYIHEEILWLSEDIIEYWDALEMLWEKIQAVEDDQIEDMENLSKVIEILDCMQKASRMLLDAITEQDKEIKEMKGNFRILDSARFKWLIITIIWLLVLTWVVVYNVFF